MSTIELYSVTALFGIFLETNKHQNAMKLRLFIQPTVTVRKLMVYSSDNECAKQEMWADHGHWVPIECPITDIGCCFGGNIGRVYTTNK